MIQKEGFGDFYTMMDEPIRPGKKVDRDVNRYDWLQLQLEQAEQKAVGRTAELNIKLKGAHCRGCTWLIEQIFQKANGSQHCEMDLSRDILSIWWVKGGFDIRSFAADLEEYGYEIITDGDAKKAWEPLLHLCFITSLSALISLICVFPTFFEKEQLDTDFYLFVRGLLLLSGSLSFVFGGGFFILGALKRYRPWMRYWPTALAAIFGYIVCLSQWVEHSSNTDYFYLYTCSIAVYMWGRYFIERVKTYYEKLFVREDLLPNSFFTTENEGDLTSFPLNELHKKRAYTVLPGKLVPVCSKLTSGEARISLGYKGRDKTFSFKAPHRIPAGSSNDGDLPLKLIAMEDWKDSDLHQQMDLLGPFRSSSSRNWPQWGGIIFSAFYVGLVVMISLFLGMSFYEMILPVCAALLILSTGSLTWGRYWLKRLTLLRLASYGMYVPKVSALSRLLRVNYVYFTEPGGIVLRPPKLENDNPLEMLTSEQRGVLLALIGKGKHPVASALMERVLLYPCDVVEIEDFQEIVGSGYTGVYKGEVWSAGLVGWNEHNKDLMLKQTQKWDCEFFKSDNMLCTMAFEEMELESSDEVARVLQRKYGIILQRSEVASPSSTPNQEMIIGDSGGKSLKMIPVLGNRWLKKNAEIFLFGGQLTHLVDLFDIIYKHFRLRRRIYSWLFLYHLFMLWLILDVKLSILWLILMAPLGSLVGIFIMGEGFRKKRKAGL
jgi:cation transport ATPase